MQHLSPHSTLQNGKYRIIDFLGQGGFGITYLATQTGTDRRVCIKEFFLKDFCNRDKYSSYVTCPNDTTQELADTYRKKFCKEAQMLKGLRHPNLVEIYDTFEENNTAYYVMEYIEGASLAEIIKEKGCLPENEAVGYVVKVATALEYVHSKKINHLDIKPANILIRKSDKQVFLIDFGTSKHYDAKTGTATTLTSATYSPGFAPIEQYRQGGVNEFTPESDVYSLGATLYKILTGITPPEPSERLSDPALEMSQTISYSTRTTIKKAMNVVKAKRYRSISEMKGRLLDNNNMKKDNEKGKTTRPPHPNNETTKIIVKRPKPNREQQRQTSAQGEYIFQDIDDNDENPWWVILLTIPFVGAFYYFIYLIISIFF